MRLALVTSVFPQPRRGKLPGIERLAKLLADGLIDRGLDLVIVTTYWNGGTFVDRYRGTPIVRVPDTSRYIGRLASLADSAYWSWGVAVAQTLKRFAGLEVVHTLSPLSTTASLVRGRLPVVATFHHRNELATLSDIVYKPAHRILEFWTYRAATLIMTPSQASARILRAAFRVPEDRIRVAPWGTRLDRFVPKPRLAGDDNRLLFVGPHEPRKGLRYLLQAVAFLRSTGLAVRLTTIGTGSQVPELKKLAEDLRISDAVEFKGYITDQDDSRLPEMYATADIFVLPSLEEGFGFVLVEAMASGLPVVAANVSAIPEVIGDAGILVPPRDPRALAAALRRLINDRDLRSQLGERGRKRAETHFSWDESLSRIIAVYRQAAEMGGA